jgi:hypothetical protein
MALNLPHDIWLLIVSFVDKDQLSTLYAVNYVLHNIVLDARYSEIQWVKLDKEMLRTLLRLRYVFQTANSIAVPLTFLAGIQILQDALDVCTFGRGSFNICLTRSHCPWAIDIDPSPNSANGRQRACLK